MMTSMMKSLITTMLSVKGVNNMAWEEYYPDPNDPDLESFKHYGLIHETAKAKLFALANNKGVWIPKSIIESETFNEVIYRDVIELNSIDV